MNEVEFPEHDVPLKNDVRQLGDLLGEVLREQGGQSLLDRVELARGAAIRRRQGDPAAENELRDAVSGMPPEAAMPLVRAFSLFFGLVNMAERIHRVRRLREAEREGAPRPGGSLSEVMTTLADAGVSAQNLRATIEAVEVMPVFTAHPTEPIRLEILAKEQRLARVLEECIEKSSPTPPEAEVLRARLGEEIRSTWQTEEHLHHKSVGDEVEHVVFYVARVIYRVLPRILETLETAFTNAFGDAPPLDTRGLLRFGTWVGGDMDGNPAVGADTLLATLSRQRDIILDRYVSEVGDLAGRLTQSPDCVAISETVAQRIRVAEALLPEARRTLPRVFLGTPYRHLLTLVRERLRATRNDDPGRYLGPEEFLDDLRVVHESLGRHHGLKAGGFRVRRLIRRVECFGFHLAALDLRQDSQVHREVAGELLGIEDFASLPRQERTRILGEARPKNEAQSEAAHRAIAVMQTIAAARERFGAEAVGPYIISMAEGADDALAVLFIARCAGLVSSDDRVPLDVVPLFETVDDLQRAKSTMEELLDHPLYAAHLEARGGRQMVMVGYSDSAKDSGIASSRWSLIRAQEELAELLGTRLTVFHGRGGSASRGGSRPRGAVLAEPRQALNGRLRLTEQGEIIHAKYGLRGIARRTLELSTGAVIEAMARPEARTVAPEWRDAAQTLAETSRRAFRALVHEDPGFADIFREVTPIDVIERLKIGSRPASRRARRGIADLRAIPWVFAWTQNRLMLTAWCGLGEGLSQLVERHGLDTARRMAKDWPFFENLLSDVEMVLAKADADIASRYFDLGGDAAKRLGLRLLGDFHELRERLLEILEQKELLEQHPVLARAIRLRNPYVDPMNFLQIEALARWRAGGREDEELERLLFSTVKGIARGLQNTG